MAKRRTGENKQADTATETAAPSPKGWRPVEEEPPVSFDDRASHATEDEASHPGEETRTTSDEPSQVHAEEQPAPTRSASRIGASEAVRRARSELTALTGYPIDAVSGFEHQEDGWLVTLEMLELQRIPPTTDVLGTYEAVIDESGELVRYTRLRRYYRNQITGE